MKCLTLHTVPVHHEHTKDRHSSNIYMIQCLRRGDFEFGLVLSSLKKNNDIILSVYPIQLQWEELNVCVWYFCFRASSLGCELASIIIYPLISQLG